MPYIDNVAQILTLGGWLGLQDEVVFLTKIYCSRDPVMPGIWSRWIKSFISPERSGWPSQFRWPLMSMAVGTISGLGAILFEELLRWSLHLLLHLPTGFIEPVRGSESSLVAALAANRSWLFLVIPALGAWSPGSWFILLPPRPQVMGPTP